MNAAVPTGSLSHESSSTATQPGFTPAASLDDLRTVNSFAALPEVFFTRVPTRGLTSPQLLHANADAARLIGLDPAAMQSEAFLAVFSGQTPLPGGDTLAAVYSGHQFGVWAGQLGDGRAHMLGEVQGPEGTWELQLKGAGMTPYSRMGDGRAVLRSSIREYLAAEAMHGLGIPTTRSLALIGSNDPVRRETMETAAIVTRMAPSFVRFGSFEHWAAKGDIDTLGILLDYVVDRFYPECRVPADSPEAQGRTALALLAAVTAKTADLMAHWQSVGFSHGVMNTDNMSILGLTLDYGPFGFMDGLNMAHICNHSDSEGRYAWNRQPSAGLWNLYRLAGALHPIVGDEDALRAILADFEPRFTGQFNRLMSAKIGLEGIQNDADRQLLDDLLALMHQHRADFTLSFRNLSQALRGEDAAFVDLFIDRDAARAWLDRLRVRVQTRATPLADIAQDMDRVNPLYVLRNHLAEQAIRMAQAGDYSEIDRLMHVLRSPFAPQPGAEAYAQLPPDWASSLEVSCSS